jgi:hypothetical protein
MPVLVPGLEASGVPGAKDFIAGVGHQHHLALEDVDELVFPAVPMALARPGAGRQPEQVDAELGQARRVAEAFALAGDAWLIVGRWIEGSDHGLDDRRVDALAHVCSPDRRSLGSKNGTGWRLSGIWNCAYPL